MPTLSKKTNFEGIVDVHSSCYEWVARNNEVVGHVIIPLRFVRLYGTVCCIAILAILCTAACAVVYPAPLNLILISPLILSPPHFPSTRKYPTNPVLLPTVTAMMTEIQKMSSYSIVIPSITATHFVISNMISKSYCKRKLLPKITITGHAHGF